MKTTAARSLLFSALLCALVFLLPASLHAGATPSAGQGGVYWQVTGANDSVSLRVILPDGSAFEQKYASGRSPSFVSQRGVLPDGAYHWEIVTSPIVSPELRAKAQSARANGQTIEMPSGSVESGSFRVVNGSVMLPDAKAVEATNASPSSGAAAKPLADAPPSPNVQVITMDLVVQGSECIGDDCPSAPSFGFDTLRLSQNNLRINFQDTSNTASFPTSDWRIVANDTTNGGASYLAFEDSDAGTQPFRVEAGAGNAALWVTDSGGNVGLGTTTPVVELQITDGDTPTVRLEQNASSGFTAQTWDVAGNEANFFVRDVTNGSQLPFQIKPGAPTSSIFIASSGNVGFGAGTAPSDGDGLAERFIDVKAPTGGDARVVVDSADGAGRFGEFLFQRANVNKWSFGNENSRFYFYNYIPGPGLGYVMTIDNGTSNVTIAKNLIVNGTFSNPSSREIKNLLASVDGASVLAKLSSLPLFTWSYKNDESVRHFGPVAEDFYERFRLGLDEKHISPNDMAGVALAATQALKNEKDAEIQALKAQLSPLQERLARLERLLSTPPKNTKATEER